MCAGPSQTCGTGGRIHDRGSVRMGIYEVVTVIVDAIADFWVAVGHAEVPVTGITDTVVIRVILAPIDHLGAIVAGIADPIVIFVLLVWIRNVGTVVVHATEAVIVGV